MGATAVPAEVSMATPIATPTTTNAPLVPAQRFGTVPAVEIVNRILDGHAEDWAAFAESLDARLQAGELQSVLVTGALRGEGYTTIALALSLAMARLGRGPVLLVEADFARPTLARMLQMKTGHGFDDVLLDRMPIENALVRFDTPGFDLLPLRQQLEQPTLAAGSPALAALMKQLRQHYRLIVIDGGGIFSGRNAPVFLPGVDAALLVRQPEKSSEHLLQHVDALLYSKGIGSLGVIENAVD